MPSEFERGIIIIMENFTGADSAQANVENPKLEDLFAKRKQCADKEQIAAIMNEIAEEIVMNARFLSLVRMENAEGGKTRISFALLNDGNGRIFYPLFTNAAELMKWQLAQKESPHTMVLAFDNYAQMIVDKNAAEGIVVNPFGDNLVVEKETVSRWWNKKQLLKRGYTQHIVQNDTGAVFSTPSPFPMDLSEALCEAAREHSEIKRLWVRQMEQDGKMSFLAVIDGDHIKSSAINALGSAAKPFLKSYGVELNIIFSASELGKRAVENVLPCYTA